MAMKKRLTAALLALGLAAGPVGTVSADAPDGHNGHGVPAMELRLNNGQKWQTDEVLRAGMSQIREVMDASLPPIHSGRYSAADLSALGDWVQEQVDVVGRTLCGGLDRFQSFFLAPQFLENGVEFARRGCIGLIVVGHCAQVRDRLVDLPTGGERCRQIEPDWP